MRRWVFRLTLPALLLSVDTAARAQCDCDGQNAVYGRVVYGTIDRSPEYAADGISSDCCSSHDTAGCANNCCQTTVCAVDASCCSGPWDDACAALASKMCTACVGPQSSIFIRGLAEGEPVPFVTVELWSTVKVTSDETDADGDFCMCTSSTPNTLHVEAKNTRVKVKPAQVVPFDTDGAIFVTFPVDQDEYDDGTVNLGNIEIDDQEHVFSSLSGPHPVSRAMNICRTPYSSAEHIEALAGGAIDDIVVRLGTSSKVWYDAFTLLHLVAVGVFDNNEVIHVTGDRSSAVWHEYGHHLENRYGAFGVIPSYVRHSFCTQHNTECWAFLEGVASWYGAVNSHGFAPSGQLEEIPFYGEPPDYDGDGNPDWDTGCDANADGIPDRPNLAELYAFGDDAGAEMTYCTNSGSWSDPQALESVVLNVLWDLVDSHVDAFNMYGVANIPEVAEIPIQDVLDVLHATTPFSSGCSGVEGYEHPVTLQDFCNEYRRQRASATSTGVFPDLYAAYAFNGVAVGCAADTATPGPVTLSSETHPVNVWSKEPVLEFDITDGTDDMSGSFSYWLQWDHGSTTDLSATSNFPTQDFQSKNTTHHEEVTIQPIVNLAERGDHYLHVQTRDLAGNLGPTATYGPVKIDLTNPHFDTDALVLPEAGSPAIPYPIGTFLHFEWVAVDDCTSTPDCVPSGPSYVLIRYEEELGSGSHTYDPIYEAEGSFDLYLSPGIYDETDTARFYIDVVDRAGNSYTEMTDLLTIVKPFDGPCTWDPPGGAHGERTVSGDINMDRADEVIMSVVKDDGTKSLYVVHPIPCYTDYSFDSGMSGGDLFLADADRDGDLDLFAAGDFNFGAPPSYEIRQYPWDASLGSFTPGITLPVAGHAEMRLRVVDLYGTGEPVLVYTGFGGGLPRLGTFNLATGASGTGLAGVTPLRGDFEVADVDADGDFDIVMAGNNAAGTGSIMFFERTGTATWTPHTVRSLPAGIRAVDLDVGNWDSRREAELFVMYEFQIGAQTVQVTELYTWLGASFVLLERLESGYALADGDGHILDIYNDGEGEIFAMGRYVLPPSPPPVLTKGLQVSHHLDSGVLPSGLPPDPSRHARFSTDTAWGDFDGDFSVDFFLAGTDMLGNEIAEGYRNLMTDHGRPNRRPAPPTGLASTYDVGAGGYVFKWNRANDPETATGALGYELRVGTTPGGNEVVSWAHLAGPSQQVAPKSYTQLERFVPMTLRNYHWSVRTVDSGWKRSMPAPEQTTAASIGPDCSTVAGDCDGDKIADACELDTDHDGVIDDCDDDDDNDGVTDGGDVDPLNPDRCRDQDGDGCDDCSFGSDGYGTGPDYDPRNDGVDTDGDGICDVGDPCPLDATNDSDGDRVCDSLDQCPGHDDEQDEDLDGVADGCDPCPADNPDDSDGDGVCDSADVCFGSDDSLDTDGDGNPDACDACPLAAGDDSDGDGVCDSDDICLQGDDAEDRDGDGIPDACDGCPDDNPNDTDYDGVCDSADVCPGGDDYSDSDGDGTPDYCEDCDADGSPDGEQIAGGVDGDANSNNIPDICEQAACIAYVDLDTVGSCMGGPGEATDAGCICADHDSDGDTDLADFGSYQRTVVR